MKQVPDSLLAFQHMFPDDDACAAWLIEMRWPDGFVCPACQRRLKIRPKGGAKDCHLGWWSDLGVRLGVGDAVRGFFGGSGQRSHAELKRSAPAGRPQGGMVYRIGVSLGRAPGRGVGKKQTRLE